MPRAELVAAWRLGYDFARQELGVEAAKDGAVNPRTEKRDRVVVPFARPLNRQGAPDVHLS